MLTGLRAAMEERRLERLAVVRDHWTREAMLDALYWHYWQPDKAWEELVRIVADYTREPESVQTSKESNQQKSQANQGGKGNQNSRRP